MVITMDLLLINPMSSVTVSVTLKSPLPTYVWVVIIPVVLVSSPKFQK